MIPLEISANLQKTEGAFKKKKKKSVHNSLIMTCTRGRNSKCRPVLLGIYLPCSAQSTPCPKHAHTIQPEFKPCMKSPCSVPYAGPLKSNGAEKCFAAFFAEIQQSPGVGRLLGEPVALLKATKEARRGCEGTWSLTAVTRVELGSGVRGAASLAHSRMQQCNT